MNSVLRDGSDYEILPSGAVKMLRDLTPEYSRQDHRI